MLVALWASVPAYAQEFDALTEQQRQLLSPLAENWERIPQMRRDRLVEMADRVAGQSPRKQERFRDGLRRFTELEGNQRQQVRKMFERFRHLPPGERDEIIQQVMTMPEDQRRAFALGIRVADRTHRIGSRLEDWLRSLPPEQRRDLQADLQDLSPPDKLRRIAEEMEKGRGANERGDEN